MKISDKILRLFKSQLTKSSWRKRAIWLEYEYPDEIELNKGSITFTKLDLNIPNGKFEDLFKYYSRLSELKSVANANFKYLNNEIEVEISGIKCVAQTGEDFYILHEIFVERVYQFLIPSDEVIVIDIGLNVGLASLFFASLPFVKSVYAFEPFEPTFLQAKRNISLNPELSKKIQPFNYGLDAEDKKLKLDYNYDNKGSVGVLGKDFSASNNKVEITLKNIGPILNKICSDNPNTQIFMKIDCEGAEYDIFEYFKKEGFPDQVKMIAMEWHRKGPDTLVQTLSNSGFAAFYTYTYSQEIGMIYAARLQKQ